MNFLNNSGFHSRGLLIQRIPLSSNFKSRSLQPSLITNQYLRSPPADRCEKKVTSKSLIKCRYEGKFHLLLSHHIDTDLVTSLEKTREGCFLDISKWKNQRKNRNNNNEQSALIHDSPPAIEPRPNL